MPRKPVPVRTRTATIFLLVLVVLLTAAACASGNGGGPGSPVRTDREPITKRFGLLGEFSELHWQGGVRDDRTAPGPSTYEVEAVLRLAPGDLARIIAGYAVVPSPAAPSVPGNLRPYAGGARGQAWSASTELDRQLSKASLWNATVFVQPGSGVVYLHAEGAS